MAFDHYPPTATSGVVQLKAAAVTAVGGTNQYRSGITVVSYDSTQTIWLYWGSSANPPSVSTVKTQGIPLSSGFPITFPYGLAGTGSGATDPTLFGVADTSDQSSPHDTRWSEGS